MLSIKGGPQGADIFGMRPEILLGLLVVESVLEKYGYDCIVTEVTGGNHKPGSRHLYGLAVDIRNRHIPANCRAGIIRECKKALGNHYDIIDEGSHFHLEVERRIP